MRAINKCRVCESKKLKFALRMKEVDYMICQTCTLLQMQEDIQYQVSFDFSTGSFAVDYYPFYLTRKKFPEPQIMFFSLKSVEVLLELQGYKVIDAQTTDGGKLEVTFEKLTSVEKIRLFEMMKKLQSQFTYFLYAVKHKN